MKYRLTKTIATVLFLVLPSLRSEVAPAELQKVKEKISIDGVLGEKAWKDAKSWKVDYIFGKLNTLSKEPRMRVKYLWDDFYLYIGYEVNDANLVNISKGRLDGPPDNQRVVAEIWKDGVDVDIIEFFITFGDQNFFWELHHNALNQLGDVLIMRDLPYWKKGKSSIARYGIYFAEGEDIQDESYKLFTETKNYRLKTAVHLKPKADGNPSTPNDGSDVDTGYTAELRLPLIGLGVPLKKKLTKKHPPIEEDGRPIVEGIGWDMKGQEISILAVIQNGDLKDRYHHSGPSVPGGWFHNGVAKYPKFVMKE
ncbi:MAG: sugar-binding protein [Planctomycetota bacterium]|nr:sugar-binding protein [Planctomycetota bacterium]MDP7250833.1 sugar-binding protein [Planctomycetota bacterium]